MAEFADGRVGVATTRGRGRLNHNAVERAFRMLATADKPRRQAQTLERLEHFRWAVARVRGGAEFAVADDLTAAGFLAYAPHGVRVHGFARVNGSNSVRRRVARAYAVFPGYVFVGCPIGLYVSRRSHEAVIGVLGDSLGLPGVSPVAIAAINRLHVAGLWDDTQRVVAGFKCGDTVRVDLDGGLSVDGVVVELRRAGVIVETRIFGRLTPIETGVDKIKALAV